MKKIIVAFESEMNYRRIMNLLELEGIPVRKGCRSGAEVIRSINNIEGDIVVCGYKLTDMTAVNLANDLDRSAMMIVIADSDQLDYVQQEDVVKLHAPISRSDLLATVTMLLRIDKTAMRPERIHRSDEQEQLIRKAKELLMIKNHMTEAQAHRFIQKMSMDTGSKLIETVRTILEIY